MLIVKDTALSDTSHNFIATQVAIEDKITFILKSDTYSGVEFNFTLASAKNKIYKGFSVSVHLFKNQYFSQRDIVDLRLSEISNRSGKVGYFFRLDSLLEDDILELNEHTFTYAYYALDKLFSNEISIQTKDYVYDGGIPSITDFFDGDTIILVICNEYSSDVENFKINNYLPSLFTKGFIKFDKEKSIEVFNNSNLITENFNNLKGLDRPDGAFILRSTSIAKELKNETYINHLFTNLLYNDIDVTSKFIILYQIIEICISKVFFVEIQQKICYEFSDLSSLKLKKILGDIQKEEPRIKKLLNKYARPDKRIETEIISNIEKFNSCVGDVKEESLEDNNTLTSLFYGYRNRIVHNYRQIHNINVETEKANELMKTINENSEVLIASLVCDFKI